MTVASSWMARQHGGPRALTSFQAASAGFPIRPNTTSETATRPRPPKLCQAPRIRPTGVLSRPITDASPMEVILTARGYLRGPPRGGTIKPLSPASFLLVLPFFFPVTFYSVLLLFPSAGRLFFFVFFRGLSSWLHCLGAEKPWLSCCCCC